MKKYSVNMAVMILIASLLVSGKASAVEETELTFDSAVFSGSVSNKFSQYKPYILLMDSGNKIGILSCNNKITSFGTNFIQLEVTDRTWTDAPLFAMVEGSERDCQAIAQGLTNREIKLKVTLGQLGFSAGLAKAFRELKLRPMR